VAPVSPRGCHEQADPTEWNSSDTASDPEETLSPQVSRPPGALDHRDQVEGGEDVDGCEGHLQEVSECQKPVSVPANAAFLR